jgi:asparagine synthase (glutamine-hydrolysing)
MCGIVGYVCAEDVRLPDPRGLRDAVVALHHRGPDHGDTFVDGVAALGFTRLSIIDLEGGGQPMANEDGSVVVVYNGEIWNYRALRDELRGLGHRFATRCDTEVLVHGYEEWGERLTEHLDGMFAFAIWDTAGQRVFVARDRLGKKPLYLQHTREGLAFGSDARSALLVSGVRPEIAREHVTEYLFQRYVVSPQSLFAGVERLPPGHHATYDRSELRISRYWRVDARAEPEPLEAEELRELLRAATERRLMSDVPIGVLLSGGVDSTAVLALMREAGGDTPATFTVGFDDPVYDERPRAAVTAKHFATEHHEIGVTRSDFLAAWPRLAWYRDEPVAEASEIPLLLLSEFAGCQVRVALSGDGGDELFGGYPKYRADAILRRTGRPGAFVLAHALRLLALRPTHRQLSRAAGTLSVRDPLVRWVSWFRTLDEAKLAKLLVPELADDLVQRLSTRLSDLLAPHAGVDAGRRMLLGDLYTYLPDNMLLRSDKVLMAGSLEGRMPLLDVEIVNRASSAPIGSRATVLRSKKVLREAVRQIVPRELLGGPKRGFPVPVERFLLEDGRALVERLLLSEQSLSRGIFRPDRLRAAVLGVPEERLPGSALFVLASFELWARVNVDRISTRPLPLEEVAGDGAGAPSELRLRAGAKKT